MDLYPYNTVRHNTTRHDKYWVLDFQSLHILVTIMQNICRLHNAMGSKDPKLGYKKSFPKVHKVKCMKMKLESLQTFDKFEFYNYVNVLFMYYGHVFQSLRFCIIYLFSVYFQSSLQFSYWEVFSTIQLIDLCMIPLTFCCEAIAW
jgi:hypothetical protein